MGTVKYSKEQLIEDLSKILGKSFEKGYYFNHRDSFLLGYIAGKYNLKKLQNDPEKLLEAIDLYDKEDDLKILDTAGEIFYDLELLKHEK